jgi:hypothetical protein
MSWSIYPSHSLEYADEYPCPHIVKSQINVPTGNSFALRTVAMSVLNFYGCLTQNWRKGCETA